MISFVWSSRHLIRGKTGAAEDYSLGFAVKEKGKSFPSIILKKISGWYEVIMMSNKYSAVLWADFFKRKKSEAVSDTQPQIAAKKFTVEESVDTLLRVLKWNRV